MLRVYFLSVSRVPVFFHEGTWHIYEGTCVVQGCLICFSFSSPRVSPNFGGANEATNLWTRILWWRIMFHVRAIALYPFNTMWNSRYILNYDDENVRKIQKHLHFNHKGTWFVCGHSVCWRFGSRDPGFESCIQQRKTTILLPIRYHFPVASASKLVQTNM